jgi:hypothetical protein
MAGWRIEGPSDEQRCMVSLLQRPTELCWENVITIQFHADRSLALQEVKKCMALFVWYFDAYFVESDQKEPYYLDFFSVKRGPLPLKIYPRKAQK